MELEIRMIVGGNPDGGTEIFNRQCIVVYISSGRISFAATAHNTKNRKNGKGHGCKVNG